MDTINQPGFSRIHLDPQEHHTNGDWWTRVPAGQMTAAAMAELHRMQRSKFGHMDTLTAGEMGEAAGTKLNRAKRAMNGSGYVTPSMGRI